MMSEEKTWLAAYLFRPEPWENFLTTAVERFVETVFENNWSEQFFFIRYWEQGPHIRLRFKGNREILETQLKSRLDEYFHNYFLEFPSQREKPEGFENLPPDLRWFPNDSIQYITYEPELERYGGNTGILIAEEQFDASSRAVMAVIRESDNWDYDRALGAAIQLHLGFAYAMGMNLLETGDFFTSIFQHWFSRAYGYSPGTAREEINERRDITLAAFNDNFQKQKAILIPYRQTLWNAFIKKTEFEQEWLNRWLRQMGTIREKLKTARLQNKLKIPQWSKPDPGLETPEDRRQIWPILESYIHMTNNRLGILNRDEAFLGYLIKESLSDVV
jgi:thiopeptide-type bacteriocin biosynthesis protein